MAMNDIGEKMDFIFNENVRKLETPFDVYKFDCKGVIKNSDAFKLRKSLLQMPFKKKSCDLYSFGQSADFFKIKNNQRPQEIQQFLNILKVIKQNIAKHLGKEFNNVISVSCSKYDHGDYLLCHDDRVDDRCVAFIYYLNYDWLDEWGGTLDIFSVDDNFNAKQIVKSISPEFNTLIFFPVGNSSYHQVAENVSNFPRVSINGWFHSDDLKWTINEQPDEFPSPLYLPISISASRSKTIEMCISPMFNDPIFREAIKETYNTAGGYIMCDEFFKSDMNDVLSNELFSNDLQWKIKGPINKRLYKYIDLNNLPFKLLFIVNMLKTDYMFQFVKDCTGLDTMSVSIEVQRWHGGHYMVSGGNDGLGHLNVINLYLFFSQCFGNMTNDNNEHLHYVFEERHTVEPKFAVKPMDNSFFLVHRNSSMDSYVKYCKKIDGHAWTVIVASYIVKNNLEISLVAES